MARWSLTPFFNELDILEIRLATLDPFVDWHVIGEATVTQRGDRKPLWFAENRERFAPWLHKIRHVVIDDMPDPPHERAAWEREAHQRACLDRGIGGAADGDVILVSDVDEIPHPQFLAGIETCTEPLRVEMAMHVYRLNFRWPHPPVQDGTRAVLIPRSSLYGSNPHEAVLNRGEGSTVNNGWHLAYMSGLEGIRAKLAAIADDWQPRVSDAEIARSLADGRDLFGRVHRHAERVPLSELPPYVAENQARFAHLLA